MIRPPLCPEGERLTDAMQLARQPFLDAWSLALISNEDRDRYRVARLVWYDHVNVCPECKLAAMSVPG